MKEHWNACAAFIWKCNPHKKRRTGIELFLSFCKLISCYSCFVLDIGNACLTKVHNVLRKKFTSPLDAESRYFTKRSVAEDVTTADGYVPITPRLMEQEVSELMECQKLQLMSNLFRSYCQTQLCEVPVSV